MPDQKVKCTIAMGPGYSGPGELTLGLPHGFKKPMSIFQKDPKESDFPLAIAELTPGEMQMYGKYGFTVTPTTGGAPAKSKPKPEADSKQ